MGMSADDHIRTGFLQRGGRGALGSVGAGLLLGPPMEKDHDDVIATLVTSLAEAKLAEE